MNTATPMTRLRNRPTGRQRHRHPAQRKQERPDIDERRPERQWIDREQFRIHSDLERQSLEHLQIGRASLETARPVARRACPGPQGQAQSRNHEQIDGQVGDDDSPARIGWASSSSIVPRSISPATRRRPGRSPTKQKRICIRGCT